MNLIMNIDRVSANLWAEAQESYKDENYFAGLACLFVLSEQALKYRMEDCTGNFGDLIGRAKSKGIINRNEYIFLNDLRNIRNSLFHDNHYANALVLDNLAYPMDEDDTKKMIFKKFNRKVLKFISRNA